MKINPQNQIRLFKGYLQGSLSQHEEISLVDWINSSDKNYQEFKEFVSQNQFAQVDSEEAVKSWRQLKEKISYRSKHKKSKRIFVPAWLKIAAIVVVALLSGFYVHLILDKNDFETFQNEVIVANGEKAQVILSDGTKVYLNSGTHFRYPSVFSRRKREVSLTGEAFFDVAANKSNPFVIETPTFDVKVLGTSFNVKTYLEDDGNTVTLHSGEVTILNEDKEYKIEPGEKYIFNTKTQQSEITKTSVEKSFLWKEGIIVIDDLNLEEICRVLERRFDVRIVIADDKYKEIRYSGQFKSHERLDEILNLIRETSPIKFNYTINGTKDEITIK
jgi:transmembrane sensor|tara:strand:- start:17607 stop:18599 length:993 start_codon:yes stop_codon:yes gene_type:complete